MVMKMQPLGLEERKLLLSAFDIDINNLSCALCKEKVKIETCSIMPPLVTIKEEGKPNKGKPVILCESILCITEYIEMSGEEVE